MKSVEVMSKGMYYNPERKETVYLEEKVYNLNDQFADLVVNEDGGDYTDEEVNDSAKGEPVKDDAEGLDYSKYDLTNGALKLAVEEKVRHAFLDTVKGSGTNGRITKDGLEEALLIALDGSEA